MSKKTGFSQINSSVPTSQQVVPVAPGSTFFAKKRPRNSGPAGTMDLDRAREVLQNPRSRDETVRDAILVMGRRGRNIEDVQLVITALVERRFIRRQDWREWFDTYFLGVCFLSNLDFISISEQTKVALKKAVLHQDSTPNVRNTMEFMRNWRFTNKEPSLFTDIIAASAEALKTGSILGIRRPDHVNHHHVRICFQETADWLGEKYQNDPAFADGFNQLKQIATNCSFFPYGFFASFGADGKEYLLSEYQKKKAEMTQELNQDDKYANLDMQVQLLAALALTRDRTLIPVFVSDYETNRAAAANFLICFTDSSEALDILKKLFLENIERGADPTIAHNLAHHIVHELAKRNDASLAEQITDYFEKLKAICEEANAPDVSDRAQHFIRLLSSNFGFLDDALITSGGRLIEKVRKFTRSTRAEWRTPAYRALAEAEAVTPDELTRAFERERSTHGRKVLALALCRTGDSDALLTGLAEMKQALTRVPPYAIDGELAELSETIKRAGQATVIPLTEFFATELASDPEGMWVNWTKRTLEALNAS